MGFTVEKKPFLKVLASVMPAVATRSPLPVLSGVKIAQTGSGYALEATDLELAIRVEAPAKRNRKGFPASVVPAKALASAVKSIIGDDGKVDHLKRTGHPVLEVSSGQRKIAIDALPTSEWPEIAADAEFHSVCRFEAKELADALERIVLCSSTDEARPVLNGVQFNFKGESLELAATDSYRLGVLSVRVEPMREDLEWSPIVPARALQALAKRLKKEDGQITFRVGRSGSEEGSIRFIGFSFGSSDSWLMREIEGEFPNYKSLLPDKNAGATFEVDSEVLSSAVGGADSVRKQKSTPVRIVLDDSCELRMEESGTAKVAEKLAGAAYSPNGVGAPMTILFTPVFLKDAISFIGDERIRMRSADPFKPALFLSEDEDRTYLLMPVRLKH